MYRVVLKCLTLLFVSFSVSGLPIQLDAASTLRSAFLGPTVWEDGLTSQQVNQELRDHFAEVLERLEAKNSSSLLTALLRAEATSTKNWSKSDRRAALIYLAHNRQKQIDRVRAYMHRGLFPINEGQSDRAVPIFVDQRKTHCAVGYLMHVDGSDDAVEEVVRANNLMKVMNAKVAGLARWVRSSGLTLEEAAMIQPAYPINLDATFEDLATSTPTIEANGLTLSSATIRGTRFAGDLPASFLTNPNAIEDLLEQGQALLDTNNTVGPVGRSNLGVLFGIGAGRQVGANIAEPTNLDDFLYIGSPDAIFGGIIGDANVNGNVGIAEIEYQIQSSRGNFSQVALTSTTSPNVLDSEEDAVLLLSQIFDGNTDEFLGVLRLFASGGSLDDLNSVEVVLQGSDFIPVTTDSLRISTLAIAAGPGTFNSFSPPLHSFFNEFETVSVAIPEPNSGTFALLYGLGVIFQRNRRFSLP